MPSILKNHHLDSLADRMRRGDKDAAEKIFNYFSPLVFRFYMRRVLSRETAEDLSQGVFLKTLGRIETFDPKAGHFSAWFWQIARNLLIDHYREKKNVPLHDFLSENLEIVDSKDTLSAKMEVESILMITKNFSPEEQRLFSLHYISDISYKELATIMGKSTASLRIAVHRINNKIKKIINEK